MQIYRSDCYCLKGSGDICLLTDFISEAFVFFEPKLLPDSSCLLLFKFISTTPYIAKNGQMPIHDWSVLLMTHW